MGFYDSFNSLRVNKSIEELWFEEMSERWPTMADAIRGPLDASGVATGKGMSVLIFQDESQLKVRLQLRSKALIAFLTCTHGKSVFDQIEQKLKTSSLEWRKDKPQR